jgi:alpha,alpha-trehalase
MGHELKLACFLTSFPRENVKTLDAEFGFWLKNRSRTLEFQGREHTVFHYDGVVGNPRPERMKQDIFAGAMWTSPTDKRRFYRAVKSACESGWDFSSRWVIHNGTNVGECMSTTFVLRIWWFAVARKKVSSE